MGNLDIAFEYIGKNFSADCIFSILKNDNELLKPIAVLALEELNSEDEGRLLLSHLTGVNGKIREVVSLKITELYPKTPHFLNATKLYVDALCDVNPNVCRNIIDILVQNNPPKVLEPLTERIEQILDEIDSIVVKFRRNKEKSHALNVKIFNLYWCLEGLFYALEGSNERIERILARCSDMYDYTIREKTAKILSKIKPAPEYLLEKLKNDDNFYVKLQLV
ncbi:hypothetical protein tpqmel_0621 [Candidatus Gastranaerophilus sp. (ex Termes propinquus)]|nr:hypothetical protein tpqmel_0621 [Candidatus Gastranaerophilus sp. (ex Termes propinquus)]